MQHITSYQHRREVVIPLDDLMQLAAAGVDIRVHVISSLDRQDERCANRGAEIQPRFYPKGYPSPIHRHTEPSVMFEITWEQVA